METKYLNFMDNSFVGQKTKRIMVISKTKGLIGEIKWFGQWRQYAFFPDGGTVWNIECLNDICEQIKYLKEERKKNAKNKEKGIYKN